jgi:hypothetical protein
MLEAIKKGDLRRIAEILKSERTANERNTN